MPAAKLGIIGGGVMGEALLSCLLSKGMYTPDSILVSDLSHERRQLLVEQYSIRTTHSNREVIEHSDVIVLAIKPQVFDSLARDFAGIVISDPPLVISILAGVAIARLEHTVPGWPVIRAMPNTPATVGHGMTAISIGSRAITEHVELAQQLFSAVGDVVQIGRAHV